MMLRHDARRPVLSQTFGNWPRWRHGLRTFGAGASLLLAAVAPARAAGLELNDRWFYLPMNLATDANIDKAEALFVRAERAGYTGVLLVDSKFSRLPEMGKPYFANVARLKKSAAEHHLEIVPGVFPLGWSNDLLSRNPNLAEGLPVRDAVFVVRGGEARLRPEPEVTVRPVTELGKWGFHDPGVAVDAAANAAKVVADGRNQRLMQKVAVAPWREYRLTVRIKTEAFRGQPEAKVLGAAGKPLEFTRWDVPATGDWKTYALVFNSQENREVGLYLGSWGAPSGTAWFAAPAVEDVGLLNVLRRAGTPLTVTREGGGALVEGKDFAAVRDPKMGTVPWAGEYEVAHDGPPIKLSTPLPDGTRLRVSWYHPMIVEGGSVMICPSEPETLALLKEQARLVHQTFGAKAYFMGHDEIRVMNWCAACEARHLSPGQLLAENVRACTQMLKEVNPGGRIYVWSDMFDPHHNAHAGYYLVNGDLTGAWEGLDKDVTVGVWYREKRAESMKFFSDRGHRLMIAGYYDAPVDGMRQWLEAAAGVSAFVDGTMYTTWRQNYADLEAFERLVDAARR